MKFYLLGTAMPAVEEVILKDLRQLPLTEFHYYVALLLSAIQNEKEPLKHALLLSKTQKLTQALRHYYEKPEDKQRVTDLNDALTVLVATSKARNFSHKIRRIVATIAAVVIALLLGIFAGISGLFIGLFSEGSCKKRLKNAGLGFVAGLGLGVLIGSRIPEKFLFRNFELKLEVCIKHLIKINKELPSKKTQAEYEADTKKMVLETFFKDVPEGQKEQAFADFLKSDQKYKIATITIGHISNNLKGDLGHHTFISYAIRGIQGPPMEFGNRTTTPNTFDQVETERTVSGQKLFEMITLERILQENHPYTVSYQLKHYDLGANDCKNYLDKILIGTQQPPSIIQRFSKGDRFWGRNVVHPLIRFFSRIQEDEVDAFLSHYKDNNHPAVIVNPVKDNEPTKDPSNLEELLVSKIGAFV